MGATTFTPADRDQESLAAVIGAAPPDIPESERKRRQRQMASAALCLMDRAGVDLLDADFDPWSVGAPASQGLVDHQDIQPSAIQMVFGNTITTVRALLETNAARPLTVFEISQEGSVPADPVILNLLFYLSSFGHLAEPCVRKSDDGTFRVSVVVSG